MAKLARIFAGIFLVVFLFLSFSAKSEASDLIKPIPDQITDNMEQRTDNTSIRQPADLSASLQPTTYNLQLTTFNLSPPSVTFGQLLDGSYEQMKVKKLEEKEQADAAKIQEILARLEASYNESIYNNQLLSDKDIEQTTPKNSYFAPEASSLALARGESSGQAINDQRPTTNDQMPSPTPTSSVSNLIANISDILYLNNKKQPNNLPADGHPMTNLGEAKKTWFTIAIIGDSMTETMGADLPYLSRLLKETYPDFTFNQLNYGQGATDVASGLFRLTNNTNYLGKEFAPVLSFRPDILVVESFAYNPRTWEKYDLDNQWLTIAKIIDTIKANSPDTKIILAATIAPNTKIFGDGTLNWTKEAKWVKATTIKLYLQNMVNFAISQNLPLADAYHPSLDTSGEGLEKYINGSDHLHPSEEGKELFAQKIMETIKQYEMIK